MKKSKKIVFNVIKKNWSNCVVILFALTATTVLSLLSPIVYREIIDNVIPGKNVGAMGEYLVILIIIPWLCTFFASVKNYYSTKLAERITSSLRTVAFSKVLHARQDSFEEITPPQIQHRLTRECGRIGELYVTKDIATWISEILTLVATLITMMLLNVPLALISTIAFPLSFCLSKAVSKKSKELDAKLYKSLEDGDKYLSEILNKIKAVKLKNRYETEMARWENWLSENRKIKLITSVSHNLHRFLLDDFIIQLIYGIMFFASGLLVIKGEMTIGTLVSFVAYVPKVYKSLKNVLNIRMTSDVIENAFAAIEEIIDLPQENQTGICIDHVDSIEFDQVSFQYNRNNFGIKEINFSSKRGQFVGIVGKSGGGKTTIFDLITGLYFPQKGKLKINGMDSGKLNIDSLRGRIAIVTQEIDLFNGTIDDNIRFNTNADENTVQETIKVLSLNEFIDRLPSGIQTDVGYNGGLLSGGERQRISIANVLLSDCDVILLDEFTSALDLETEKKVMSYLWTLKGKQVIIISHRIYALMRCDKIYVVSKGEIIEEGNPGELKKNENSIFSKMLGDLDYLH